MDQVTTPCLNEGWRGVIFVLSLAPLFGADLPGVLVWVSYTSSPA